MNMEMPLMHNCNEIPDILEFAIECELRKNTFFEFYINLLILRERELERWRFDNNWYEGLI